jgi:hypothetical protein
MADFASYGRGTSIDVITEIHHIVMQSDCHQRYLYRKYTASDYERPADWSQEILRVHA